MQLAEWIQFSFPDKDVAESLAPARLVSHCRQCVDGRGLLMVHEAATFRGALWKVADDALDGPYYELATFCYYEVDEAISWPFFVPTDHY